MVAASATNSLYTVVNNSKIAVHEFATVKITATTTDDICIDHIEVDGIEWNGTAVWLTSACSGSYSTLCASSYTWKHPGFTVEMYIGGKSNSQSASTAFTIDFPSSPAISSVAASLAPNTANAYNVLATVQGVQTSSFQNIRISSATPDGAYVTAVRVNGVNYIGTPTWLDFPCESRGSDGCAWNTTWTSPSFQVSIKTCDYTSAKTAAAGYQAMYFPDLPSSTGYFPFTAVPDTSNAWIRNVVTIYGVEFADDNSILKAYHSDAICVQAMTLDNVTVKYINSSIEEVWVDNPCDPPSVYESGNGFCCVNCEYAVPTPKPSQAPTHAPTPVPTLHTAKKSTDNNSSNSGTTIIIIIVVAVVVGVAILGTIVYFGCCRTRLTGVRDMKMKSKSDVEMGRDKKEETGVTIKPVKIFDAFLSHDWGENGYNHKRVEKINTALRAKGLKTWIDSDQLRAGTGYEAKMLKGIDDSKCSVVFITKNYMSKINSGDMSDNCAKEFNYARNRKNTAIITVVMEKEMLRTDKWELFLGTLSHIMYVDMTNLDDENVFVTKIDELHTAITSDFH